MINRPTKYILLRCFTFQPWMLLIVGFSLFTPSLNAQQDLTDYNYILNLTSCDNRDSLELALALAKETGFEEGRNEALRMLGSFELERGELPMALGYYLELLNRVEHTANVFELMWLYDQIGLIYKKEDLYDRALSFYKRSYENCVDDVKEKEYLQEIADLHFKAGRADSALYFQKSLLHFHKKEQNVNGILNAEQKMIAIYNGQGEYSKSLKHNKSVLGLIHDNGNEKLLATCYNNLAYNYNALNDYKAALEYFEKAELLNKDEKYLEPSILFTNTGIVHANLGDINKAISYFKKADKEYSSSKKQSEAVAELYHLMATVYLKNGDLYNSLLYNIKAGRLADEKNYAEVLGESYNTSARIYQELYEYEKALDFYKRSLVIKDSILLEERLRQQNLLQQQFLLERSEKEIKILLVNQENKNLAIHQLGLEKEKLELASSKLILESEQKASELQLLKKEQEVKEVNFKNNELEKQKAEQTLELTARQLEAEKKDRRIFELNQIEKMQNLELDKKLAEEKKRLQEIELLTKDKVLLNQKQEIANLEIEQQAVFRQSAFAIGGLLALMMLGFLGGYLNTRRKNTKLAQQNIEIENQKQEIEMERVKSEELLLNILPEQTAKELKAHGSAKAKQYDQVTVLFTDFKDFTKLVANLAPQEIINELNTFFIAFDEIAEKYNLERIKTIGDSFMCAGGIPVANQSNALDAVYASLEMQKFVKEKNRDRALQNRPAWQMRIGIHTGPVIAGVVGLKKFAYDIWGDAVNTASRMETTCEVGKVNISGNTFRLVENHFDCTFRGAIAAKNKGDIDMYFVDGLKQQRKLRQTV